MSLIKTGNKSQNCQNLTGLLHNATKLSYHLRHDDDRRAVAEVSAGLSGAQARDPVGPSQEGRPPSERSRTRANVRRVEDHRRTRGSRPAVGWLGGAARRIGHLRQELADL